jgi:hypothetical protein
MGYSLISALLIFYIIIINCFTHDLISKQVKRMIETNRYTQHIISILMLFIIIVLLLKTNISISILYTIIGYILYILTTKMDIQINIIVFIILLCGFIYEHTNILKEEEMNNDPILLEEDKNRIKQESNSHKIILLFFSILIIGIGTFLYYDRKIIQHAGHFSNYSYFIE